MADKRVISWRGTWAICKHRSGNAPLCWHPKHENAKCKEFAPLCQAYYCPIWKRLKEAK